IAPKASASATPAATKRGAAATTRPRPVGAASDAIRTAAEPRATIETTSSKAPGIAPLTGRRLAADVPRAGGEGETLERVALCRRAREFPPRQDPPAASLRSTRVP